MVDTPSINAFRVKLSRTRDNSWKGFLYSTKSKASLMEMTYWWGCTRSIT